MAPNGSEMQLFSFNVKNRDVPDFTFPNPAGAGTGAGFENLVQQKQHKT